MIKNNKGFTLIELLAVIVLLGLITTFTIVTVVNSFEDSKKKAEEVFEKQLTGYVKDYIALYGGKLDFKSSGQSLYKCYKDVSSGSDATECESTLLVETTSPIDLVTILDYIVGKKVKNPNSEKKCEATHASVTIYKDSDYVYCSVIKPSGTSGTSCLKKTISTCENIYKESTTGTYKSFE